uniref:Uncharacterized protein n=1 Tax=Ixodes ricinus TaxID=34613 RepID=A0A6B0UIR5_IXORI
MPPRSANLVVGVIRMISFWRFIRFLRFCSTAPSTSLGLSFRGVFRFFCGGVSAGFGSGVLYRSVMDLFTMFLSGYGSTSSSVGLETGSCSCSAGGSSSASISRTWETE